nr:hypothetical protein [Bacteroidota bacterium]
MKHIILSLSTILFVFTTLAQTPQAINYQAITRSGDGYPVVDQVISVKISILAGSAQGEAVYSELHNLSTNSMGLFALKIGDPGQVLSGSFEDINWNGNHFFLKVEIDENGGSEFTEMSISQLLAVPYALYAENTAHPEDADADPQNELQTIQQTGSIVTLSDGGGSLTDEVDDADANPANELQQLNKVGNTVSLSQDGGNFTDEVNDADNDPANELQDLGNTKNGNLVTLNIDNGTGTTIDVTDTDANPANEIQTLEQSGLQVSLSQSGETINIADNDNDATNEIQVLNKTGSMVSLSHDGGTFNDETDDADNDPANELQTFTVQDYQVTLSNGGNSFTTGVKSYTQAEIDALIPYEGLTVHNITTNCINYYFLDNWFETCGTCTPQPTQANAGDDQIYNNNTTSVILSANTPEQGTGIWTIESGDGGSFDDNTIPNPVFTGQACNTYTLAWTISNTCGYTTDQVEITFFDTPTTALAGNDQAFTDNTTSTTLTANTPETGQGSWTVVSGEGGSFDDPSLPEAVFYGQHCTNYQLAWTIATPCDSSTDEVSIAFYATPTIAIAGNDMVFTDNTTNTPLSANTPETGQGLWSIDSGEGGNFDDPSLPEAVFTGQPCTNYTLSWTIATPCDSSTDQVDIIFFPTPSTADAGNDIVLYNGDLSVNLSANTPEIGQGQWSILNGTGGTFNDAGNPATLFTGLSHVDYTLQWTISTACASSSDEVDVAFKPCLPFTDPRDGQNYTTVLIGEQCWMQKNLNYSTGNSWCYANNSAFCDLIGRLYSWDAAINACPAGWHLPSDTEWCILEQEVDPTITCNATFYRGTDGGTKLKVYGSSGFWAHLVGVRNIDGTFAGMNIHGYFWTSSTNGAKSWYRSLWEDSPQVYRMDHERGYAFSVRCLQSENPNQPPEPPSSPSPENGAADQSTLSTLSWTCSDPDNDPLTYDVYFGSEATPPQIASGQTETTFNPGLDINTAYFWKIVAHDDHLNVSEGPLWSFTTDDGIWDCGEPFLDSRDNQIYESVQIGSQCWMAENLNIGVMVNMGSGQPNNEIIEKYCHANNNADCDTYGGLYEYWEMILHTSPSVDICPGGWHVPIVDEWCILENYVDAGTISSSECYAAGTFGTDAGGNLKETGTSHWLSPNAGATNSSGFTALGSGSTYNNNSISMIKVDARFWAKDWAVGTTIHSRGLHYNTARIKHSHVDPYSSANGVRCIKD